MTEPVYIAVPAPSAGGAPSCNVAGAGKTVEEALRNLQPVWPLAGTLNSKLVAVFAGAPVSDFNAAEKEFMQGRPIYADEYYLNGLVCLVDVTTVVTYTKHTSVLFNRTDTTRKVKELAAWSENQPGGKDPEPAPQARMTWRKAAAVHCLIKGDVPQDCPGIRDRRGRDGYGLFQPTSMINGIYFSGEGSESFVVDEEHWDEPVHPNFTIYTPTP